MNNTPSCIYLTTLCVIQCFSVCVESNCSVFVNPFPLAFPVKASSSLSPLITCFHLSGVFHMPDSRTDPGVLALP